VLTPAGFSDEGTVGESLIGIGNGTDRGNVHEKRHTPIRICSIRFIGYQHSLHVSMMGGRDLEGNSAHDADVSVIRDGTGNGAIELDRVPLRQGDDREPHHGGEAVPVQGHTG